MWKRFHRKHCHRRLARLHRDPRLHEQRQRCKRALKHRTLQRIDRYDRRRPAGQRLLPGYPQLDGKPLEPQRTYRVLVNNYIAGGGDGLSQLKDKKQLMDIGSDLDALSDYLKAHEPAMPPTDVRVEGEYEPH